MYKLECNKMEICYVTQFLAPSKMPPAWHFLPHSAFVGIGYVCLGIELRVCDA